MIRPQYHFLRFLCHNVDAVADSEFVFAIEFRCPAMQEQRQLERFVEDRKFLCHRSNLRPAPPAGAMRRGN